MNSSLKSSVYVDLLKGIFADVADDLGLDLHRELEKVTKIWQTSGFKSAQHWIELKLESFVVRQEIPKSVEFSGLFQIFLSNSSDSNWELRVRAYAHARQILHLFRKLEDVQCQ